MWTAGTFLFERMGTSNKIFVEFGVEHGLECNTYYLTSQMDWSGLMIKGNPAMYDRLRENLAPFPKVKTVQRFITKDNICETLEGMQVPQEFDLLSIDIDGNDYWVWQALHQYRPRVTIIEFNAYYQPPLRWVMAYNQQHIGMELLTMGRVSHR